MSIENYVGRRVEVIYLNSKGRLNRRVVSVLTVTKKSVYVFDWGKQAYRTLSLQLVLAIMPDASAS
ncbi:hypothetical protein [Cohnella thailandensis]|uniref:WYL domain-containing protein n=1 Tax=Cohnella thailandensis TaxID=557557 RepID=A0A841T1F8_9BACL|nr:hypothetical protein [Cohnella thailandensis]MBB6636686.1 hypothetical protein [Cohnella thailandensis]MBP1973438.1 hypothetical protein [Cohnella thailandensis]